MRIALLLIALLALTGCRQKALAEADYQILCSPDGRAFYVTPVAVDASFVHRTPNADVICQPLKLKTESKQ